MLLTLALFTSLFLGQAPEDPAPRLAAARILEAALGDGSTLPRLERASADARELLGADSLLAADLAKAERVAAFARYLGEDDALAGLSAALGEAVDDLRFRPRVEADLPEGFPPPTPVREIRVRRYPAYRLARVSMSGRGGRMAFGKLFLHIQRNEIAMTAPVETTYADDGTSTAAMAFLYGSTALGETGEDGAVEVLDVPERTVISLGLRGNDTAARVSAAKVELGRWLERNAAWRAAGDLRVMGWNSPMVRGDRRFFEVQIPVEPALQTLIDFTAEDEAARWSAVDDVVMGGRSSSSLRSEDGHCVFSGTLSLENNGGFASVRTKGERCSLAGATSLVLRVRGDGRGYRLRLRTGQADDRPSWQQTFSTVADEWIDVPLALDDFELKWRGRLVTDAAPLDPVAVRSIGLLIADEQQGPFRLELDSLSRR